MGFVAEPEERLDQGELMFDLRSLKGGGRGHREERLLDYHQQQLPFQTSQGQVEQLAHPNRKLKRVLGRDYTERRAGTRKPTRLVNMAWEEQQLEARCS